MDVPRKKTTADYVILIVLLFLAVICVVPLLNTVAISFSDRVSAQNGNVFIWPVNFTLNPYGELIKDSQFFKSFLISIERVLLGSFINLFFCVLTAFPLSKSTAHFHARNRYMWFMVALMVFPPALIPTYVLVVKLGLINSIWSLVLPGALPIFSCIMMMNSYKTLIPSSLEEAALIDGADPWYILFRIFIPLSKPTIAVIALWAIVGHWNDFFSGLIYIMDTKQYPLQTYIYSLNISPDFQNLGNLTGKEIANLMSVSNLTFNAAKVTVAMIPILCIYPFLQRFFVTGIVMGAVKE